MLGHAEVIFAQKLYDDAVSRAYYAVFHASKALLISRNLDARSHSGVATLLNQHFIRSQELDVRFGKIFTYSKELREGGDYDTVYEASQEDAEVVLADARIFLSEVERLIALPPAK